MAGLPKHLQELSKNPVFIELTECIREGRCVAFIGAGISKPIYPSWEELIDELCDACGCPKLSETERMNPERLRKKADECKLTNPRKYKETLWRIFSGKKTQTRKAYNFLTMLPFASYVTTNFDTLLRDASGEDIDGVYCYPDLPSHKLSKRSIFYIHGIIEKDGKCRVDSLVLGEESFQKAYSNDSLLPSFLKNLFTYYPVVFLGFSLRDPSIQSVLQSANKIRREIANDKNLSLDNLPKRYILLPKAERTDNRRFEELGVRVIGFEIRSDDFYEIESILEWWVNTITSKRKAPFRSGFE